MSEYRIKDEYRVEFCRKSYFCCAVFSVKFDNGRYANKFTGGGKKNGAFV